MYHFVFQNNRHRQSVGWRNRFTPFQLAYNQGELDRRLLNKSLKTYTITGCGEHEIQKTLAQVGLRDVFFGHVLEVETKKQAMWVKLNFDVVARKGLAMKEVYLDLDLAALKQQCQAWHNLSRAEQMEAAHTNQSRMMARSMVEHNNKVQGNARYGAATQQAFAIALSQIEAESTIFNENYQELTKQKEQEALRLRKWLETHLVGSTN